MIWQSDSDKISNSLCAFDLKLASGLTQAWFRHSKKFSQVYLTPQPCPSPLPDSTRLIKISPQPSCSSDSLKCRTVLGS